MNKQRHTTRRTRIFGWPFDHPVRVKIKESIGEIEDWEYFKRELE